MLAIDVEDATAEEKRSIEKILFSAGIGWVNSRFSSACQFSDELIVVVRHNVHGDDREFVLWNSSKDSVHKHGEDIEIYHYKDFLGGEHGNFISHG